MKHKLTIKWIYAPPEEQDGIRILVDNLWPHGWDQDELGVHHWCQQSAPSSGLKRQLTKGELDWKNFARCYRSELHQRPEKVQLLLKSIEQNNLTLLTAERDLEQSWVQLLKEQLELWISNGLPPKSF
ncbi:MAG: DUF488 family protein [Marinospirillum sp.]|uniref:DUF488 domain-containing protein n=1 Tax=Marinospirillum sp. TaxID=2183934 RepID=UPI0019F9AC99|nr:DUF488 family protein [Marinospirillum sp.]MBE0507573.1 DUF488 family protein [Marinospirillum sp.]